MSNSQNKKNEQQNNLCTTLTEQWKKGELKSGWYFVKVGNYEAEIDLYDDDQNQWFNCCDKDIYPVEILAPVPSYEEWERVKKYANKCEVEYIECANDYEKLKEENQQLKELLGDCQQSFRGIRVQIEEFEYSMARKTAQIAIDEIDNAIGDK